MKAVFTAAITKTTMQLHVATCRYNVICEQNRLQKRLKSDNIVLRLVATYEKEGNLCL